MQVSGARSKREVVDRALRELVARAHRPRFRDFIGVGDIGQGARSQRGFDQVKDCLIAAVALENGVLLVHNDRDFVHLAQVEPALMIYPGRPH